MNNFKILFSAIHFLQATIKMNNFKILFSAIQATVELPNRLNTTTFKIKLKNIVDLKQDKSASIWHRYKDISVQINTHKVKSLQCKRKRLKAFIFFDEIVDASGVKVIKENSSFYLFAYNKRQEKVLMERLLTERIKGEYCIHLSPS